MSLIDSNCCNFCIAWNSEKDCGDLNVNLFSAGTARWVWWSSFITIYSSDVHLKELKEQNTQMSKLVTASATVWR